MFCRARTVVSVRTRLSNLKRSHGSTVRIVDGHDRKHGHVLPGSGTNGNNPRTRSVGQPNGTYHPVRVFIGEQVQPFRGSASQVIFPTKVRAGQQANRHLTTLNAQSETRNESTASEVQASRKNNLSGITLEVKFGSVNRLREETNGMLERLKGKVSTPNRQQVIGRDQAFFILAAWMEVAKGVILVDELEETVPKQGRSLRWEAAMQTMHILDAMEDSVDSHLLAITGQSEHPGAVLIPFLPHYEIALQALAVCNENVKAAEVAQSRLERMIQRCRQFESDYGKSGGRLRQHKDCKPPNDTDGIRLRLDMVRPPEPSVKVFNIVVNCWAKSQSREAGIRAEHVVDIMKSWKKECEQLNHKNGNAANAYQGCTSNERTLVGVLDAWSKSQHERAPERASSILHAQLEEYRSRGNENAGGGSVVRLDPAMFHAVIQTWVNSNRGREAAMKAENILETMLRLNETTVNNVTFHLRPNARTYMMVLGAWSKCERQERTGKAARRAEEILKQLVRLASAGHGVISSVDEGEDGHSLLIGFTTCITAWSGCADTVPEAPLRAEALWRWLAELMRQSGGGNPIRENLVRPANVVLLAWSNATNRRDSTDGLFRFLEEMKSVTDPDVISYNTVLSGLSKRRMGTEAVEFLEWMRSPTGNDGKLKPQPDLISYNSALSALARQGGISAAIRAQQMLEQMEHQTGDNSIRPNKLSYTSVINAWSLANDPSKARRAKALVYRMIEQSKIMKDDTLMPDVVVFTVWIKTCSLVARVTNFAGPMDWEKDTEEALSTAFEAMELLESNPERFGQPNHVTFWSLMVAIDSVLSGPAMNKMEATKDREERRKDLLKGVFERCKERGMVSKAIEKLMVPLEGPLALDPSCIRNVPAHDRPALP